MTSSARDHSPAPEQNTGPGPAALGADEAIAEQAQLTREFGDGFTIHYEPGGFWYIYARQPFGGGTQELDVAMVRGWMTDRLVESIPALRRVLALAEAVAARTPGRSRSPDLEQPAPSPGGTPEPGGAQKDD